MPKNIVVFSDGTGQEGGLREEQRLSNVYKLYRVCRVGPDSGIGPREQVAFYDPGLGPESSSTGFVAASRYLQKLLPAATGLGITKNITDCYEFSSTITIPATESSSSASAAGHTLSAAWPTSCSCAACRP